jgi:hypothetical protein
MDHDPTGYRASEFVIDLLSNREFLNIPQARKIAMNVVARDTTGTSAWMLVKASWLAPKQVRLSDEERTGYLKLAADRSLINQYGQYAIEYGLMLMGVPRPIPDINVYAVRPYAYDHYAYDRNELFCNPWIDYTCIYSNYDEPRTQRPFAWNPLWSLYKQMGDFNWMLYMDCIDNASYKTGEDGCSWPTDQNIDDNICHQNMLSLPSIDYQLGMKYLNHAVDLIKRGQTALYFKKIESHLPVQSKKDCFQRAEMWQNEVINHLQYSIDTLDRYNATPARPYLVEILKAAMIKPYR